MALIPARLPTVAATAGGLLLAAVAAAAATYVAYPGYLDHIEPSVAALAWRLLHGAPLYLGPESPDRITLAYGPAAFAVHLPAFAVLGGSIAAGKISGAVAAVAAPLVLFAALRRHGPVVAWLGLAFGCAYGLYGLPHSLWDRAEPFLALLVALAAWAVATAEDGRSEWRRTIVLAVAAGLAVNMKVYAGVYFVPLVLFHCCRRGVASFAVVCGVAATVVVLPFAFPAFSLETYLGWLRLQTAGKTAAVADFGPAARKALLFVAPAGLGAFFGWLGGARPGVRGHILLWSFFGCVGALVPLASLPGASPLYFHPFVPITVMLGLAPLAALPKGRAAAVGGAMAVAVAILSIPVQKRFYRALDWNQARAVAADVAGIVERNSGRRLQMGYGSTLRGYKRSYHRVLLVFAGQPYTFDGGIDAEMSRLGVPLPEAALQRLGRCDIDVWLIPAGERPFAMKSYYGTYALPDAFRAAFARAYAPAESSAYFDLWRCRGR